MDFQKATFKIYYNNQFKGTGFRVNNSGIIFTAKHVIRGCDKVSVRSVHCKCSNLRIHSSCFYGHPDADLAALFLEGEGWEDSESFPLHRASGLPSLGTNISTYGYTCIKQDGNPEGRFLKGYIQRTQFDEWKNEKFWSFEGSFASTNGLSGSPVFLDNENKDVIGLLYCSEAATYRASFRYMHAVHLPSVSDWIDGMIQKEPHISEVQRRRGEYLGRFETQGWVRQTEKLQCSKQSTRNLEDPITNLTRMTRTQSLTASTRSWCFPLTCGIWRKERLQG